MASTFLQSETRTAHSEDLSAAIAVFRRHPAIRRARLFGSAGRGRTLDWRSDLDFAVEGLLPGEEYGLWSELDEVVSRPVDLVRLEDANELLKSEILKGHIIYEN